MKKILTYLLPPVALVAGFVIWYYLISDQALRFGAQEIPQQQSWGVISYGYLMTVLGVVLGSAYRELQKMKEAGQTQINGTFFKNLLTSIDLWMSLIGSPLVYALLWKSVEGGSIASLTLIALENGFCCNVVISNIVKSKTAKGAV